jgi:hypothetical protein
MARLNKSAGLVRKIKNYLDPVSSGSPIPDE